MEGGYSRCGGKAEMFKEKEGNNKEGQDCYPLACVCASVGFNPCIFDWIRAAGP